MKVRWTSIALGVGLTAWLVGVVGTMALVWRYKLTPGDPPAAPEQWPAASAIHRDATRATVVMITHPQCPCTRASITELDRLAHALGDRARIHVVLVRPDGTSEGFEDGAIKTRASTIPNTTVIVDAGGREADRFGAVVSGSTVVYAPDGRLLFRGGITAARGHEGKSPAFDRIVALVSGAAADRGEAPAFGCAVKDPGTLQARTP
jgi:hypothetical protein